LGGEAEEGEYGMRNLLLTFLFAFLVCWGGTAAQANELKKLADYESSDGGGKSWFELWANDSVFEVRTTLREHRSGQIRKGKVAFDWTRWPDFRGAILDGERRVVSARSGELSASDFPMRVKTLTGEESILSIVAFYVPQYTGGISLVIHPPEKEPSASEDPGLRLEYLGDPDFINLLLAGERAYGLYLAKQ